MSVNNGSRSDDKVVNWVTLSSLSSAASRLEATAVFGAAFGLARLGLDLSSLILNEIVLES